MRFLLLGTGTSAGIPVIGCDCEVCTSDDPRDRRTRSGAAISFVDAEGRERLFLLDCGPDHREHSIRHRFKRVDGILFTHDHVDHTFGLDDVRRYNALMKSPIEVFADARTREFLERVYRHIFRRHENVNDSFVADLFVRTISPGDAIDRHGLRFTVFEVLHGRLPVLAFRVEALDAAGRVAAVQPGPLPLAYCTDLSAMPPAAWPRLSGLRTLVLDMLRYRAHPTHLTVDEAVAIAARTAASRTVFVHMTHDIRHATLAPELPAGMELGYDGLVLSGP
ncbi:MAG: MBL fold metallo-hydrolase [Planctomycetaceae bacterium]|nr:MBL fold metallo-hydrolase [Planctomycetaceae bacterium]